MVVDSHPLFCRRHTILHRKQHIGDHVQQYGHVERRHGHVHQSSLSPLGHQAPLEPFRRYHQDEEVVDHGDAGAYVLNLFHNLYRNYKLFYLVKTKCSTYCCPTPFTIKLTKSKLKNFIRL